MTPYADFTWFALLLYLVVPTLLLGLLGRAGWRWALLATAGVLLVQYHGFLTLRPGLIVREIWIILAFAFWEWLVIRAFAISPYERRWPFYWAMAASLLPLACAKVTPLVFPQSALGFLGISYVTFRALDLVFCLRDKVIRQIPAVDFFSFLFFFPTISAGPIDRYRRFTVDWKKTRTRAEFLRDLDGAVHRVFRGFLYKFIVAALIKRHWLDPAAAGDTLGSLVSYMYAYSLYLFFDFAGYSAFAIAFSYLFGIHTPENFDRPFLARNIRDFWTRWHITLSFWFRDHVYMRFVLAATRGRWFRNPRIAGILGYFLAFGLMGLWHGLEPHFLLYGLYQALLLSAFDIFSNWNKVRRVWGDSLPWRIAGVVLTFHFVCFGFLIFSGRLGAAPLSAQAGAVDRADCNEISGWVWNKKHPDAEIGVDIFNHREFLMTVPANEFRQDLADAGYGNGRHAFHIPTPPEFKDGHEHQLRIRISGSRRTLTEQPIVLTCP